MKILLFALLAYYIYTLYDNGKQLKGSNNSYIENEITKPKQIGKENAAMVMLVRNRELPGALDSIRSLEDRFNRDYHYPWIFFNDEPFTDDFIEKTSSMTDSKTYYEIIPHSHWNPPSFINQTLYDIAVESFSSVIYGWSKSYRNMCHYNSGYFYKQKILQSYDYYFRVEPDVQFLCDFGYDPFEYLRKHHLIYGFTIAIYEYENTIPTLWKTVKEFMSAYPNLLHPNNALDFLLDSEKNYNGCHFWSNFEIADLNFFRSEAYNTYFDFLDKTGGFYYERWGDAPVHSIGLSLLADKSRIHHFDDLGYYHPPLFSCPGEEIQLEKKCICKVGESTESVDLMNFSCLPRWWKDGGGKKFIKG